MTINELLTEIGIEEGPWTFGPTDDLSNVGIYRESEYLSGKPFAWLESPPGPTVNALVQSREMLKQLIACTVEDAKMGFGPFDTPYLARRTKLIEAATKRKWSWIKSRLEGDHDG